MGGYAEKGYPTSIPMNNFFDTKVSHQTSNLRSGYGYKTLINLNQEMRIFALKSYIEPPTLGMGMVEKHISLPFTI